MAARDARRDAQGIPGHQRQTRRHRAGAAALLCLVALALLAATSAGAYDRKPIVVAGLTPDRFGQSTTKAERQLVTRYPGISSAYCEPVIMQGDEADSSFTNGGLTRFWDKLACGGYSRHGHLFICVFDAKGPQTWIIYRLKGVSVNDLY